MIISFARLLQRTRKSNHGKSKAYGTMNDREDYPFPENTQIEIVSRMTCFI